MSRPLRIEFPGAIYHVMARGVGRMRVFDDETDYLKFLVCLAISSRMERSSFTVSASYPITRTCFVRRPAVGWAAGCSSCLARMVVIIMYATVESDTSGRRGIGRYWSTADPTCSIALGIFT